MNIVQRLRAFLTLPTLGTVASVVGIVGGGLSIANSLGGGSGGGGGGGSTGYVPQAQGTADTDYQNFMTQFQQALKANGGNMQAALTAAEQATAPGGMFANNGQTTSNVGNALINQAGNMQGAQQGLLNAGNQLYQTSLDPQHTLFNQQRQQVADAANANSSMRGIGMGAQAAGLSNQADSNFLTNWQNQQLQRQAQGVAGLQGASGTAGQLNAQGFNDLTGGVNTLNQGAMSPYQLGQAGANLAQTGIYNPLTQGSNQTGQYLTIGQQGGTNAFNQGQVGLNNLTSGLNTLGNSPLLQGIFSGGGGGPSTTYGGSSFDSSGYGTGYGT
jgi:hypothetical protein